MIPTFKGKILIKQIVEFPNYYITDNGRVWSKPRPNTKGGTGFDLEYPSAIHEITNAYRRLKHVGKNT